MGFFVTATDTNVGKTYFLSLLLKFLVFKGIQPSAMKPIETGCAEKDGTLFPEDGYKIAEALGCPDKLNQICPLRFKYPLAPYVCSEIENKQIDIEFIKDKISALKEPFFIEGAGGLLVPVKENYFMIDLAKDFNLNVILVSPLRLGTINHTLLSIEALQRRDIKISGVILNDNDGIETMATKTNPETLKKFTEVNILGVLPFRFSNYQNLDKYINLSWLINPDCSYPV